MDPQAQVTLLLRDAKNGQAEALQLLIPIVYDELRRLAAHYLRDERAADTLQPTSLVHEAYMRLVAQDTPEWECRAQFDTAGLQRLGAEASAAVEESAHPEAAESHQVSRPRFLA